MNFAKTGILALALCSLAAPFGARANDNDGGHHKEYFRVDCRYHNVENVEGVNHCYASATYAVKKHDDDNGGDDRSGLEYSHVRFGVGCDQQTIYNDYGRIHVETVGERISPKTAAYPAVEIQPEGSLSKEGTYESVLDIEEGRLEGKCYVHRLHDKDYLPFD